MLLIRGHKKHDRSSFLFSNNDGQICEIGLLGANFPEKVRKELLNCYRLCPSLYKILLSKGTPFYTQELSHIIRGPHRYTRTVRVPIPRPKIPVTNRINSSRYFFTGTKNKMPRC